MMSLDTIVNQISFNEEGLVPVITQDNATLEVLMMAWMNREALEETLKTGILCFFSRSRKGLWRKGETSGQTQTLVSLTIDCDGDTLLARVIQKGVACHTGRKNCFFKEIQGETIVITHDVVIPPSTLYGKDTPHS
jgi:phosphoribosyl-AMP cyclohydrolase